MVDGVKCICVGGGGGGGGCNHKKIYWVLGINNNELLKLGGKITSNIKHDLW